MTTGTSSAIDSAIEQVIETFDEIVKPDGGHVELVAVDGATLRVGYSKGVNEQCVECVMEPDALAGMMKDMLADHAPEIDEVVVEVATGAE